MSSRRVRPGERVVTILITLLSAISLATAVEITFDKDFIEANKNRATITVSDFHVVDTLPTAKPIDSTGTNSGKDGDIHCAGWADSIWFATVAEISNARLAKPGINALVGAIGGTPIKLTGVWRVWPEHASQEPFEQGSDEKPTPATKTNPPHVFEIHPLTAIGDIDLGNTFTRIRNEQSGNEFAYKKAAEAFDAISKHDFTIRSSGNRVTVDTSSIGYNYIRFRVRLDEKPEHQLDDGGISFFGSVFPAGTGNIDNIEVPLVGKTRFILAPGTKPLTTLQSKHAGDVVQVIGLPRLSFALLSWRVDHGDDDPAVLSRSIPYEIVILAVL